MSGELIEGSKDDTGVDTQAFGLRAGAISYRPMTAATYPALPMFGAIRMFADADICRNLFIVPDSVPTPRALGVAHGL